MILLEVVNEFFLFSISAQPLGQPIKPQIREMKQYRRYFPRVRIRSTLFIFVTVSITSHYNGGLKNENFVVKIYRCFTVKTIKISKATFTLEGDSGEEVALWLLTSLCTSANREVEVSL
jgi:hypothetical protein